MVRIVIDNYIKVSGLPYEIFEQVRKRLTYSNPDYERAVKYRKKGRVWGIPATLRSWDYDKEAQELLIPRGVFLEFMDYLGRAGLPFEIIDRRQNSNIDVPSKQLQLRSYQEKLLYEGSLYPGPGYILQSPPGTGKTVAGLELARQEGRKTLWIVHKKFLAKQAIESAIDTVEVPVLGIPKKEIGIIGAGSGKISIGEFLTVATIQTIKSRAHVLQKYKYEFGTLIIDEVHHAPAPTWSFGSYLFSPQLTVGLTATAYREDGLTQMLFDYVGPVVAMADIELLKKEGVLIVPTYCVAYTNLSYRGKSFTDIESQLSSDPRRNNMCLNIIKDVLAENPYNVVLFLSRRVKHIDDLTDICFNHGLDPIKLHGQQSKVERNISMERLDSGQRPRLLLATYDLLSEGFNYKPISHVIFGTPFRKLVRLEQSNGRAQRTEPLKQYAMIIDLVDNCRMLIKQANLRRAYANGLGMPVIVYNQNTFRS